MVVSAMKKLRQSNVLESDLLASGWGGAGEDDKIWPEGACWWGLALDLNDEKEPAMWRSEALGERTFKSQEMARVKVPGSG